MATPWLKVEVTTTNKHEVRLISTLLGIHRLHAFGLCVEFWAWCDGNLKDGRIHGGDAAFIDDIVHHVGFAAAMLKAGWLLNEDAGIIAVTHFMRHLGNSTKNRSCNAKYQADYRKRKAAELEAKRPRKKKPKAT